MSTSDPEPRSTGADRAEALLDAHVEHELTALGKNVLSGVIADAVAAAFDWLREVRCNELFSAQQVRGILERNVIELKVSGGITELAGEMSRAVFASKLAQRTRVQDICPPEAYSEFADKIVALNAVRRELVRYLTQSDAFVTLVGRMLARMLIATSAEADSGEPPLSSGSGSSRLLPEAQQRLKRSVSRLIESWTVRLLSKGEQQLFEALDPEALRDVLDEVWDAVAVKPLDEAAASFTAQDLEDFVVLGYEFWLKFRKTPYFRSISGEVIERVFAKYGDEPVAAVIADMGVTEAMVSRELECVLSPIVDRALRTGFLEQLIRARLQPFYRSAAVGAILSR